MLMKTTPLYRQDDGHPQARVCLGCTVRSTALFGALDPVGLDRIHTNIASPALPAEHTIYRRGHPGQAVYTIRSGLVRFERVTESGDRRVVRLAGRGDLIGQEAFLRAAYEDDALACTPVELCRIPVTLLDDLGEEQRNLLRELMRRWQLALEAATRWSAELRAGPSRQRLLRLLVVLQRHVNEHGQIWLPTRELMGDMLDITEETASRIVSQLRREGVLRDTRLGHARLDAQAMAQALAAG